MEKLNTRNKLKRPLRIREKRDNYLVSHRKFKNRPTIRFQQGESNSKWVSPTQVVPKKLGITVIKNENEDEIQTKLTIVEIL
ncbi:unnamed protein product [Spirodela intermedia]|uniref:Uncharacterized protein n=1 Tax=Spirodela intermedia TaxID=51605 RepID=A0A7I8JV80_SPIIN|nr:unnamed protein product [Spirodela intermedia]CAA6673651.1 unnamed protein product [Spirodela intermedia]